MTETEDCLKIPDKRVPRGGLDEPVVEVPPHADTHRVENGGNRSHDPGEDLRGCGKAETESLELVHPVSKDEAEKVTRGRMDRHLKIRFLEIDGGHPVALTNRQEHRLNGLHLKMRHVHKAIEYVILA